MNKCAWCRDGGLNETYHDEEWGVPLHDDRKQFEFLMLEVMQCGLSWTLMLKKRETFRACFAGFDYEKVAAFTEADVERILNVPNMIRSPRKVRAVINNARKFMEIRQEFGSFSAFLWRFTNGRTYVYPRHRTEWVARNALSDMVAAELVGRGFKYLGSITVYSHLQAAGLILDHEPDCFRFAEIAARYPIEVREGEL